MKRQRFVIKTSSCLALFSSIHSSAFTSTSTKRSFRDISHPPVQHVPRASPFSPSKIDDDTSIILHDHNIILQRRIFLSQFSMATVAFFARPSHAVTKDSADERTDITTNAQKPFHSAAYGQEEYTNSIVASRDTNISPREVYDTIASDYLKNVLEVVRKDGGGPRALDVGAGAGVSTEVLYRLGYHRIDALDWSGTAWQRYVTDDPSGYCPPTVKFYELDDERYLDFWRATVSSTSNENSTNYGDGLFDVIVFNFAVNESKAKLFAKQLLNKNHGILLAPINTMNDYWLKQNYKIINSEGTVLWSTADVGAWSVQFQPDVTQDTCSGVWCAPFNGFQKKR
ncbi:hypothetical protein ACHAW6_002219 [Cyclotella cf. meneghiniana]